MARVRLRLPITVKWSAQNRVRYSRKLSGEGAKAGNIRDLGQEAFDGKGAGGVVWRVEAGQKYAQVRRQFGAQFQPGAKANFGQLRSKRMASLLHGRLSTVGEV